MTREEAIKELSVEYCGDSEKIREAKRVAIKTLEQIPKLQNRCHALTHGLMCGFCSYECEHKAEK